MSFWGSRNGIYNVLVLFGSRESVLGNPKWQGPGNRVWATQNPIIHDSKKRSETWRLQPDKSGISCCIGDIGTHAFDMLEYVTGMEVEELLSDLMEQLL